MTADNVRAATRSRRTAIGLLVAGTALVIAPFAVPVSRADSSAFLGFNLFATADPFSLQGGDPNAQGYPQATAQVAHTETRLGTGPSGYALSSILWPGQFLGNLGSLVQAFNAPESANQLNYPVRAEAFSPAGPLESNSEGMSARTEGDFAEAIAEVPLQDAPGFAVDVISSRSRTEVVGDQAISHAETVVTGLSLGDGQVTIESISSVAEARSDGTAGANGGRLVVQGLEIGGQPAQITDEGIRIGDSSNPSPAGAVAQQIGEQVLSNLGMEIFLTSPVSRSEGSVQEYRSGSLVIVWDPFNQGQGDGTVVIGGSSAYAQASPALPAPTIPETPVTTPPTPTLPTTPVTVAPSVLGENISQPPPLTPPATTPQLVDNGTQTALPPTVQAAPETDLVSHFDGFGVGAWILVLAGAAMAQVGLVKFQAASVLAASSPSSD